MDEWTSLIERDRIERYAESFRQLAEIFREMPEKKERLNEDDIQEIFETVREKVCASCGRKQVCWIREQEKTWKLVYRLLQAIEDGQEQISDSEKDFYRFCVKGRTFREELERGFLRARLNMLWANRMMENRAAVAGQLQQTATIIKEIACTAYQAEPLQGNLEQKLKMNLRLHRVMVKEIGILRNVTGHPEMILTLSCRKGNVPVSLVADILTEVYGRPMVPERDSRVMVGKDWCSIHFVEETRYYMLTGCATEKCSGQSSSGDNYAILNSNHGQVIMAISDGMGKGVEASQESQTIIELVEQFLEAGFTAETAVKMIHSSMVLQRGVRRYSTLDLLEINLYQGKSRLLKVGAAATFIRREHEVEVIHSTSLAMGMLREADVETEEVRLENGDMVFMISDGVLDALPPREGENLLKYFIENLTNDNPAQSAQILMDQVLEFCQEGILDDMTILSGGFWKK